MFMLQENATSHDGETDCASVKVVTENGYSIVRACETNGASPDEAGMYRFIVSDSEEQACEVIVEFDTAAIALVQSCRREPLSSNSLFWINCAERSLAAYLWDKDKCPPQGRLTLQDVCLDDLDAARLWDDS